ncbi:hypothetical protein Fot_06451 [Forsythia ovata]|uniref:Uncharacterized protein n=1 Tax=Forsythia ovata TaxID=205694 RepID=A0ABD1WT13_9LAMI
MPVQESISHNGGQDFDFLDQIDDLSPSMIEDCMKWLSDELNQPPTLHNGCLLQQNEVTCRQGFPPEGRAQAIPPLLLHQAGRNTMPNGAFVGSRVGYDFPICWRGSSTSTEWPCQQIAHIENPLWGSPFLGQNMKSLCPFSLLVFFLVRSPNYPFPLIHFWEKISK